MATLRRQRVQQPDASEYAVVPGDRNTEYVEVGKAYPLPTELTADSSGNLSSSEQFFGLMLTELVRIREAVEQLADSTLSP